MKRKQPIGAEPADPAATAPESGPADDSPGAPEALAGALPAWDLLPEAPFLRRR